MLQWCGVENYTWKNGYKTNEESHNLSIEVFCWLLSLKTFYNSGFKLIQSYVQEFQGAVSLPSMPVPCPVVSLGIPVLWKGLYKRCFDIFKQAIVADTGIHKVFNSSFLSVLLKCLATCRDICVEDMIK